MTVLASLHVDGIQRAALLIVAMIGTAAHVAADVGIGVLPAHEKVPLQSNFFRRYPAKLSCPADRLAIRPENLGKQKTSAAQRAGGAQTVDKPIFFVWGCMKGPQPLHI